MHNNYKKDRWDYMNCFLGILILVALLCISLVIGNVIEEVIKISIDVNKLALDTKRIERKLDDISKVEEEKEVKLSSKKEGTKYVVPENRGFKSYMGYEYITAKSSPQYKLQEEHAYTGKYGIRQVNDRYCVAVGSHFTDDIGTYVDLELANGEVIPCILADQKANEDTDESNISTMSNGCVSEFVVDSDSLYSMARKMGDISYCNERWDSPVVNITVYKDKISC